MMSDPAALVERPAPGRALGRQGTLAVVLNWNQPESTEYCVQCVLAQRTPADRILIIDNGSTDDSLARLQRLADCATILRLPMNLGFAGGMNAGLEAALHDGFEFVWLLNNDAYAASDCLEALLRTLSAGPDVVMVGPRLTWPNGAEQPVGGRVALSDGEYHPVSAEELGADLPPDCYLAATAPLVRVSAIEDVGPFEPAFFSYFEDADLNARLHKLGKIQLVLDAVVVHHCSLSTGGSYMSALSQYLMVRNSWLYLSRQAPPASRAAQRLRFIAQALSMAEVQEVREAPTLRAAALAGLFDARRGRFGRPESLTEYGAFERLLSRHPTRARQCLLFLAAMLDRLPHARRPDDRSAPSDLRERRADSG